MAIDMGDHKWRQAWMKKEPVPSTDVDILWLTACPFWKWWQCQTCGEVAHIHWIGYEKTECKPQSTIE